MTDAKRKFTRFADSVVPCCLALITYRNLHFAAQTGEALAVFNLGIDTEIYHSLALQLLSSEAPGIPPGLAPGFPIFLASVYAAFGPSPLAVKLVHCVLLFLIAVQIWLIGRHYFSRTVGALGAVLTVTSPMLVSYAVTLQYELLVAFLFSVMFSALLLAINSRTLADIIIWSAVLAVTAACCTLTREPFLLLAPFFFIYLLLYGRAPRRAVGLSFAVAIGLYLSIVGWWVADVHRRTGLLVPISAKGPINLDAGNNPGANGTFNLQQFPFHDNVFDIPSPKGLDFVRHRPLEWAALAAQKADYFFGFRKDGWNVPRYAALVTARLTFGSLPYEWCLFLARSGLSLLFLASLPLLLRRAIGELSIVPLMVVLTLVLQVVLMSAHRYALPYLPQMALFAAYACTVLLARLSLRLATAFAALFAGLYLVSYVNPPTITWNVPIEATDGALYGDERIAGEVVRYFPAAGGPRFAAVNSDEYFPRGPLTLALSAQTDCHRRGKASPMVVEFLVEGRGAICRQVLPCKQPYRARCALSEDAAVRTVVYTTGAAELRLSALQYELGAIEQ